MSHGGLEVRILIQRSSYCRHFPVKQLLGEITVIRLVGCALQTMAPKKTATAKDGSDKFSLEGWKPTAEDLAEAKKLLDQQDPAKRRSSTACMVSFVAKTEPALAAKLASLRGEDRQAYVVKYQAMMLKKRAGTLHSSLAHTTTSAATTDYHFWNKHKMTKEVGEATANHWIKSGLLEKFGDRITNDMSDDLCEFKVPVQWLREREQSDNKLSLQGDQVASKADVVNIQSLQIHNRQAVPEAKEGEEKKEGEPAEGEKKKEGENAGGDEKKVEKKADPPIKKEPGTEGGDTTAEEIKKKICAFVLSPAESLKLLQNYECEAAMIIPIARANELMNSFCEQMVKHLDQIKKMSRGVAAVVAGKEIEQHKLPNIIKMMDILKSRHTTLVNFAIVNGIWEPAKATSGGGRRRAGGGDKRAAAR